MPSFSGSMVAVSAPLRKKNKPDSNIVTLDVGGSLFQTTKQTLSIAAPNSLLHSFSSSDLSHAPFIDRDPELFSLLLSLLRTGYLPSKSKAFDLEDLLSESYFYGIDSLFLSAHSHRSHIDPFTLQKSATLPLNGRDTPSAISTTPSGALHVAHGSKITSFDSSLRRKRTILTQFAAVDSLLSLSPSLVASGATDFSGLQVLDLHDGLLRHTLTWENATRSGSTVQAIGSSPEHLFASFESGRRTSNTIMVYDLNRDLLPVAEIGQREIYGAADMDSDMPATKLCWIPSRSLLMSSGSHAGPSVTTGSVKLWDLRSATAVWEMKEKVDCFADLTVSESLSAIFKVGVDSGEVFFADMRKLEGGERAWVCLGEERSVGWKRGEGSGCRVESNGEHVFRTTKGGEVEMWSEVVVGCGRRGEDGLEERVLRRNSVGGRRGEMEKKSRITQLRFGGNNMFVCRKDEQCVEVWQSSSSWIRA